jgi:predicted ArsR family transcriptional regulator
MGFFDKRVLATLKDGKPRDFTALMGETDLSHNILQQHPDQLVTRGLVVKEKMSSNTLGRPNALMTLKKVTSAELSKKLNIHSSALVAQRRKAERRLLDPFMWETSRKSSKKR